MLNLVEKAKQAPHPGITLSTGKSQAIETYCDAVRDTRIYIMDKMKEYLDGDVSSVTAAFSLVINDLEISIKEIIKEARFRRSDFAKCEDILDLMEKHNL